MVAMASLCKQWLVTTAAARNSPAGLVYQQLQSKQAESPRNIPMWQEQYTAIVYFNKVVCREEA
jgi:hypothetical protein